MAELKEDQKGCSLCVLVQSTDGVQSRSGNASFREVPNYREWQATLVIPAASKNHKSEQLNGSLGAIPSSLPTQRVFRVPARGLQVAGFL